MKRFSLLLIGVLTLAAVFVVPTGLASIPADRATADDATTPPPGFHRDVFAAEDGALETAENPTGIIYWPIADQDGGAFGSAVFASPADPVETAEVNDWQFWSLARGDGGGADAFGSSIFAAPADMSLNSQGDVIWFTTGSDGGGTTFGSGDVFGLATFAAPVQVAGSYARVNPISWATAPQDGGGLASVPADRTTADDATTPAPGFHRDVFEAEDGALESAENSTGIIDWPVAEQDGGGFDEALASRLDNWRGDGGDDGGGAFGHDAFDAATTLDTLASDGSDFGDSWGGSADDDGGGDGTFDHQIFASPQGMVETTGSDVWAVFWPPFGDDGGGLANDTATAPTY